MHKTSEDIALPKTAGVLQNELAKKESVSCTHLDLGYAFSDETYKGVIECIERHWDVFGNHVTKFCVVALLTPGEGTLKYVIRRNFYAWPYLPDPTPNQSVWLIDKSDQSALFLWSLPTPERMVELSESFLFLRSDTRTKAWCDAFYKGYPAFWECIRKMHGIDFLSESEFNARNREMGGKYVGDDVFGLNSNPLYLPEMRIKKLETMSNIALLQPGHNFFREAN